MDINTFLKREPDLVCYYNVKGALIQKTNTIKSKNDILDSKVTIRKVFAVDDPNILKPVEDTITSPYNIGWLTNNVSFYVNDKKEVVGRLATKNLSLPFGSIVFEDSRVDLVNVNLDLEEGGSQLKPNSVVVSRITSGNKDFVNSTGFVVITTDETDIRKVEVFFDKK